MNLQNLAYSAEILIGIATLYSLYLSRKALTKSDWNSALSTVPSLIIRPRDIYIGLNSNPLEAGWAIIDKGRKIEAVENDTRRLIFNITFESFNAGRGVAFNLKKPKVKGEVNFNEGYKKTPLHQSLEDEPFEFSISIIKTFNEWRDSAINKIPVLVEIYYTNDQGNVNCISNWKAELQPFTLENSSLIVKEERVLNRNSSVKYTPKN